MQDHSKRWFRIRIRPDGLSPMLRRWHSVPIYEGQQYLESSVEQHCLAARLIPPEVRGKNTYTVEVDQLCFDYWPLCAKSYVSDTVKPQNRH